MTESLDNLLQFPEFFAAFDLQQQTLRDFYSLASEIAGPKHPIGPIPEGMLGLRRNFFSTFFLAVIRRLVDSEDKLPLYAMVNQGMRAWVTACDNILDDEYKEIFLFAPACNGTRMRSILSLMLAERVIVTFVLRRFGPDPLETVCRESLQALQSSAMQEAEEETRPVPFLPPAELLRTVHQRKTADLFAAPLRLPTILERPSSARATTARTALEQFGMGCQILDDVRDMASDNATGRHNLLLSLLAQQDRRQAESLRLRAGDWSATERFPELVEQASSMAEDRFRLSFAALAELGISLQPGQRQLVVQLMTAMLVGSP